VRDEELNEICFGLDVLSLRPELSTSRWAARVLLLPSFHPVVCITIRGDESGGCVAEVRVEAPRGVCVETTALDESVGRWLVERIEDPPDEVRGALFVDGMIFAAALCNGDGSADIAGHASDERFAWIADLVKAVYGAMTDVHSLRGLAAAGIYVDLKLPMPDAADEPPPVRIGVLGAPGDRAELLAALDVARPRRRPPK